MLWWRASLLTPNKLRMHVSCKKQLKQPGNITNTQHVRIKCQRDIHVRMYSTYMQHPCTHTHVYYTYYVRMVFKDNSMSKMKVWASQLVHDYKPSEAGI